MDWILITGVVIFEIIVKFLICDNVIVIIQENLFRVHMPRYLEVLYHYCGETVLYQFVHNLVSKDTNSFCAKQSFFKKINLFILGCVGFSLLHVGFLWLRRARATLHCSVWASPCGGFSCCGAQALGAWASVVVVHGF